MVVVGGGGGIIFPEKKQEARFSLLSLSISFDSNKWQLMII